MLITKVLIPHFKNKTLRRSRLLEVLNQSLNHKLTLISAPPGYGKTSLMVDWVKQCDFPVYWLSLDQHDTDDARFLNYLITSFQEGIPEFGQHIFELVKSQNRPSNETIIGLLINELLKIDQPCLLILDDFHSADSRGVSGAVSYLLENMPTSIHVVIATRADPILSLAKLRSLNQLLEIRMSDLAFTTEDIFVLFNKNLKIALSKPNSSILANKTEGWIAGLQLVAQSLQNKDDPSKFIRDFSGDNRYIMDYLIEEVLNAQPEYIREFLLQTSILDRFSYSLCDTLLDRNDSHDIIKRLEKSNAFIVPLDTENNWYRYQHLFADLLNQKLFLKDDQFVKSLHEKSIHWYEANQLYDLAIKHALIIKDYKKSIQLIEHVIEQLWKDGLHTVILNYGNIIPEIYFEEHPTFCLYYGWILFNAGQSQKAQTIIDQAYNNIKEHFSLTNDKELLGKIALAKAHLMSYNEHPGEMVTLYSLAIENLSEKNSIWLGWAWKLKGMTEIAQGNINEGIQALIRTVEYGKKTKNLYLISSSSLALAYHESVFGRHKASYERCLGLLKFIKKKGYLSVAKSEWMYAGLFTMMSVRECVTTDFDLALENVKNAYSLCKSEKDITQKIIALLAFSYISFARGNKEEAENKLFELEELMERHKISPYINTTYVGWKLYLLILSSQLEQAQFFANNSSLSISGEISFQNESSYLNFTRLLIARAEFEEAKFILDKLFAQAKESGRVETMVQVEILRAVIYIIQNSEDKAVSHMISAIKYSIEEELLIYFLFDLELTNSILEKVYIIQATSKTDIPKAFIRRLQNAIKKKESRLKLNANFELSDRELDTLKLMADNMSNKEIAEELFVTVNTVKTHIKSIYSKLYVNNRLKALEKAKKYHLLA